MRTFKWLICLYFTSSSLLGQKTDAALCSGASTIAENVSYQLNFLGKKKVDAMNLFGYCNLSTISNNYLWFNFTPRSYGNLNLLLDKLPDSLTVFIFECKSNNPCGEIADKKASLILCNLLTAKNLNQKTSTVFVRNAVTYYIAFNTLKTSKAELAFTMKFEESNQSGIPIEDSLSLNLVSKFDQAIYALHLVDELSRKPVVARIYISSSGNLDGAYRASDLRLNNTRNLKATIRIDAQGYFSKDLVEHRIVGNQSSHDTISLVPITSGAVAKLEDINFVGGLSVISDESLPKLKRLKDFLVLNPSISIEIQGHVNEEGENSMNSQRLSKKRAQKIMSYLIQNGINADRLTAVGFGNSMPLFAFPVDDEQRESNRRVEIKVN